MLLVTLPILYTPARECLCGNWSCRSRIHRAYILMYMQIFLYFIVYFIYTHLIYIYICIFTRLPNQHSLPCMHSMATFSYPLWAFQALHTLGLLKAAASQAGAAGSGLLFPKVLLIQPSWKFLPGLPGPFLWCHYCSAILSSLLQENSQNLVPLR